MFRFPPSFLSVFFICFFFSGFFLSLFFLSLFFVCDLMLKKSQGIFYLVLQLLLFYVSLGEIFKRTGQMSHFCSLDKY